MPSNIFKKFTNLPQTVNSLGQQIPSNLQSTFNSFVPSNVQQPDFQKLISEQRQVLDNITTQAVSLPGISTSNIIGNLATPFANIREQLNLDGILNRANALTGLNLSANTVGVQSGGINVGSILNTGNFAQTFADSFGRNILDDYDNVTYNIKFMMAPETAIVNANSIDASQAVIIAQSGVTADFLVREMELKTIVGANNRTFNQQATLVNLRIVEPRGISLIDRVMETAARLGINSIMNCPMLLELNFQGYNRNGTPEQINIANRMWRVQVANVDTNLTQGGSEYVFELIVMNDFAFHTDSAAAIIKQEISFPVSTLGKFFDDLAYYLEQQDIKAALQGNLTRNEYEFRLTPDMRSWKLASTKEVRNVPKMFTDINGSPSVAIKRGTTLSEIVVAAFAATEEGNRAINPSSDPNFLAQANRGPRVSKIPMIGSNVEYIGYDTTNNNYNRKFIYYIYLMESFRAITDTPSPENDDQRIAYMLQSSLRRKYEYIFTGNNLEILDLDINLNTLWRQASVYYPEAIHRKRNNSSNLVKSAQQTSTTDGSRPDRSQNRNIFQVAKNIVSKKIEDNVRAAGNLPFVGNAIKQATPVVNQTVSNVSGAVRNSDFVRGLTDPRFAPTQRAEQLQKSGVINADELRALQDRSDALNRVIPIEGQPGSDSYRIVPESRLLAPGSVQSPLLETTTSTGNTPEKLQQLFIRQIDPAMDINYVNEQFEETPDNARSVFGVIMNNLYEDGYANLLKIDMTVRGDPYWLGETDLERIRRMDAFQTSQGGPTFYADYLRGENTIFVTFRTPTGISDSTGLVEIKNADIFVGIYSVISISHSFSDGKFVQRMEAIRDLNASTAVAKRLLQR